MKQAGRKEEAKQALEEGLSKAPGDPEILFHLAQLSADRGDHALAVSQYKEVLSADISGVFTSLDPGILSWKARHNMALSFLALGDYPGAREQWQTALRETGRPELAIALLGSALEHGDMGTAKGLVAWAAERFGPTDVWAQMVESLCSSVGLDPAPQLGVVLSRDPENLPVRKTLARVLLNSGRSQDAVGHLDLLQSRGEAEGAFFLGVLSEEAGDSRKACAWYERALELNPSHQETSRRLRNLA